jgi:hypothetical protein
MLCSSIVVQWFITINHKLCGVHHNHRNSTHNRTRVLPAKPPASWRFVTAATAATEGGCIIPVPRVH